MYIKRISIKWTWIARLTQCAGEWLFSFFQSPFEANKMFYLIKKFVLFTVQKLPGLVIICLIYYLPRSYRLEINKPLKWNILQVFLKALTRVTLQNSYFWGTPRDDCFCLEVWFISFDVIIRQQLKTSSS